MSELINFTGITNLLKDFYTDEESDQSIQVNVRLLDEVEKVKGGVDADGFRIVDVVQTQQNTGTVTTAFTNSTEPTAGTRSYDRMIVQPAYLKHVNQFDQQLIQMSKTNEGAFLKQLDGMIRDSQLEIKKNMARQINGDGSGSLAELTANVVAGAGVTIFLHDTTAIQPGMRLCVFSQVPAFVEAITVLTVDPELNTITADTTVPYNSLYFVVQGESASLNNFNGEMLGVRKAIDKSGTYININRATSTVWRSPVMGVGGGIANRPTLFNEANGNTVIGNLLKRVMKKDDKGNTKAFEYVMTDFEAYNYIVSQQTNARRFNDNVDYKIGVSTLAFNDNPVERDAFCSKEHAAIGRLTVLAAPTYTLSVAPNTVLVGTDVLEVYRGNTLIGHLSTLTSIGAVTFDAVFTAFNGGVLAVGDVAYIDIDTNVANDYTAPRVYNNAYFINHDSWRMAEWQPIQNLNEAVNGLQFEKVAGSTQFRMIMTGMVQPYTVRPNNQGRYRFVIPQSAENKAISVF